ncbi:MAG: hypothetical protein ACYC56_08545 [Candidatus Aquicultor sp.]
MKKGLIILMALAMLFAMTSVALAVQDPAGGKGNITPNTYDLNAPQFGNDAKDWQYYEQGEATTSGTYAGSDPTAVTGGLSTHPYGTWNSPYTMGIDGYNYNDAQDYTDDGADVAVKDAVGDTVTVDISVPNAFGGVATVTLPKVRFASGPHGGYLTSTHRCRECHAVHRAAGKFKLLRSDTRFEACDWCHGTGAGSGFNIQMDNDDNYTTEYNVGHTMGFGISSGKWKAPDDTYPAYTPNYWMGGFSCFDCHSPHANPARLMGFDQDGNPIPSIVDTYTGEVFVIGNPGHDLFTAGGKGFAGANHDELEAGHITVPAFGGLKLPKAKPYYLAGSWLLIKNPDHEIDTYLTSDATYAVNISTWTKDTTYTGHFEPQDDVTVTPGGEIPDLIDAALNEFSTDTAYPVNKVPTDWNNPIGSASLVLEDFGAQYGAIADDMMGGPMPDSSTAYGYNVRNPFCRSLILDEFCTDCHDGNAGFHTTQAPLFSEDRALRNQGQSTQTIAWQGNYDLAYGHDANVRH